MVGLEVLYADLLGDVLHVDLLVLGVEVLLVQVLQLLRGGHPAKAQRVLHLRQLLPDCAFAGARLW